MTTRKTVLLSVTFITASAITGCKTSDPIQVEDDFGSSVRSMVESQIYVPEPQDDNTAPAELDGDTADNVVEQYVEKNKKTQTGNNVPSSAPSH